MHDTMSEHLKTLNGNEKDPNKIRDAAKAMKENLPKLKESVHRDELRELRTSVEKHLKEQSQEDTKTALTELRDELAKNAIDEPILPKDAGKKAAEVMPDMLKPATEKTVDGANEALQRTYEEGKHLAKKVEGSEVYQEGKKRVEGFLEEAKEKGTFTAVKDRMQDMWENGGAGGKILVGTGLVAAGYLTYKALSWLWEKLEEGSVLAWGAVAGALGYGGYKLYQNREEAKKKEVEEAEAKKKAEAAPKQSDGSLPLDKLPPKTVLVGPNAVQGRFSVETGPNKRTAFGVVQEKNREDKLETRLVIDGKKYSVMSIPKAPGEQPKNLSAMINKVTMVNDKEMVINVFPDVDIDATTDQIPKLVTDINESKKVELQAMFDPKKNPITGFAFSKKLDEAVKKGEAQKLPDGRFALKAMVSIEEVRA